MTIEDAIKDCRDTALRLAANAIAYLKGGQRMLAESCEQSSAEHEQIAKWLEELKHRRDAEPVRHGRMTNGDRIRQMPDEELAEMVSMKVCRIVKPDGKGCPKGFYFGKCDKCVLKWLKQEVKNEGTDD